MKWTDGRGLDKLLSAFAFYLTLLVILHAPFLFFHQSLYLADMTYNLEPAANFIRQFQNFTGDLPLWNPYVMGGVPQIQVCWPIAYIAGLLFLAFPFPLAMSLCLLLHQLVAGLGGFIWQYYGRQSSDPDRHLSSAVLFGLAFMLCGYMVGSSLNPTLLVTACWIPLGLFLIVRLAKSPRLWCLAAIGLLIGLQMTVGRPELVALSLVLYSSYLICRLHLEGGAKAMVSGKAGVAAVIMVSAVLLGLAFAAVDWVPMLELVSFEPKIGSLVTMGLSYWSARWFDFVGLLLSQPLGYLDMSHYNLYLSYPGQMPYITSLYLGAPLLMLSVIGFRSPTWKERWFWLFWAVAGTAVAAGALVPVLARIAPDLLVFRYPIKASVILLLSLCAAATEGWRQLLRGSVNIATAARFCVAWAVLAVSGMVLLALPVQFLSQWLVALGAGISGIGDSALVSLRRLSWEIIVAGSSGLLVASLCLRKRVDDFVAAPATPVRAVWLLIIALTLTMNGACQLWHTVDASFFDDFSQIADWLANRNGHDLRTFRVLSLLNDPLELPDPNITVSNEVLDYEVMSYARNVLQPNTNIDFGIQLINGVSTIPTWNTYFLHTGLLPRSHLRPLLSHPAGKSDLPLYRWCQASTTRYVLTSYRTPGSDEPLPVLDPRYFHIVKESTPLNLRIYEIAAVRPRWSLQDRYLMLPDRYTALTMINRCDRSGYDPLNMVLISKPSGLKQTDLFPQGSSGVSLLPGEPPGDIDLVRQTSRKTTVYATVKAPSFLVITDGFYPGWTAVDNGVPSPIYLADGLYRAVYLTRGRHEITLLYSPQSLLWGIIASKIAFMFIASVLALSLLHAAAVKIRIA